MDSSALFIGDTGTRAVFVGNATEATEKEIRRIA